MNENEKPEPRVSMRGQSTVTHRSNIERLPILVESMRNGVASLLERWMKTEGAAAGHTWVPDSVVRFEVDEYDAEVFDDDDQPYDPPRYEPYTRITAERPFIEGPGALVAPSGWCAPSDQVYDAEPAPPHPLPEVRAIRGERWEQAAARMRARREEQRAAAVKAGLSLEALDGREEAPDGAGPGRWEYAIRDEEGGLTDSYRTAQEAFNDFGMDPGDEMVRRWVHEPLEWEVVP